MLFALQSDAYLSTCLARATREAPHVNTGKSELFPPIVTPMPRLQWLREHGVNTWLTVAEGEECPITGKPGPIWNAWQQGDGRATACAPTEAEAIAALAIANGWEACPE